MKRWWWAAVALTAVAGGLAWAARPSVRMTDDERGKMLYLRHCVQCHGVHAGGDGPAAAALVHEVPDLRERLTREARDGFAEVVLDGRGAMPGYQNSFDKYDARRILRHMERAARRETTPEDDAAAVPAPPSDASDTDDAAGGAAE